MSGVQSHSFDVANHSEYYAQVLLSALGLSTPIPRQEDIGFDFTCSLSDQESGVLTFGHPYLVSVKSFAADLKVTYESTDAAKKANSQRNIIWLFRQEIPAYLGVVDRDGFEMRLYSMMPLWFLYYENGPKCGAITLVPRFDPTDLSGVNRPQDIGPVLDWEGMRHYQVDLGHPVAIINLDVIKSPARLAKVKSQIRLASQFAQMNHVHQRLGIPYFYWLTNLQPDGGHFDVAFWILEVPPDDGRRKAIMRELAPSLMSFGLSYKKENDQLSLDAVKRLLQHLPESSFPQPIRDAIPEIITKQGESQ